MNFIHVQMGGQNLSNFYKPYRLRQAQLLATINMIQEQGLLIAQRMEWVKKLDSDIFEIRSKVSNNIQCALYFHIVDDRFIITHGFTKKTQKSPTAEIKHAKALKKEFEENNNGNH